jgi:hypothetical protein
MIPVDQGSLGLNRIGQPFFSATPAPS